MAIKLTKATCFEKWKVFDGCSSGLNYYIGPKHGRLIVAEYLTKEEAVAALEMKGWLMEYLEIKEK